MGRFERLPTLAGGFYDELVHLTGNDGYLEPSAANCARDIRIRIYRPNASNAGALSPVIVYFHGGGFVLGAIESVHHIATRFAAFTGFVVINVDYRLGLLFYQCISSFS